MVNDATKEYQQRQHKSIDGVAPNNDIQHKASKHSEIQQEAP